MNHSGLNIAKDIIESIINNMNIESTDLSNTKKKNPDLTLFEWGNRELGLNYIPNLFTKFEELSRETFTLIGKPSAYWNRSVMTLYEVISFLKISCLF